MFLRYEKQVGKLGLVKLGFCTIIK